MKPSTTNTQYPAPKRHISIRDISYAAAMLDAEGYILGTGPNNKGKYATTRCAITNTDLRLHEWLIRTFGGLKTRRRSAKSNTLLKKLDSVARDCYDWSPGPNQNLWFLKLIRSHLKLKQQQADCAIALLSLPGHAPEKRRRLAEKIWRLNRGKDIV